MFGIHLPIIKTFNEEFIVENGKEKEPLSPHKYERIKKNFRRDVFCLR